MSFLFMLDTVTAEAARSDVAEKDTVRRLCIIDPRQSDVAHGL
jgi:hypothetical protein